MTIRDRLLDWFGLVSRPPLRLAAPVRVDARPRCPKCGRVLLRFLDGWLCSNCRRPVRRPDAA
jgi:hypothetical protein